MILSVFKAGCLPFLVFFLKGDEDYLITFLNFAMKLQLGEQTSERMACSGHKNKD